MSPLTTCMSFSCDRSFCDIYNARHTTPAWLSPLRDRPSAAPLDLQRPSEARTRGEVCAEQVGVRKQNLSAFERKLRNHQVVPQLAPGQPGSRAARPPAPCGAYYSSAPGSPTPATTQAAAETLNSPVVMRKGIRPGDSAVWKGSVFVANPALRPGSSHHDWAWLELVTTLTSCDHCVEYKPELIMTNMLIRGSALRPQHLPVDNLTVKPPVE